MTVLEAELSSPLRDPSVPHLRGIRGDTYSIADEDREKRGKTDERVAASHAEMKKTRDWRRGRTV